MKLLKVFIVFFSLVVLLSSMRLSHNRPSTNGLELVSANFSNEIFREINESGQNSKVQCKEDTDSQFFEIIVDSLIVNGNPITLEELKEDGLNELVANFKREEYNSISRLSAYDREHIFRKKFFNSNIYVEYELSDIQINTLVKGIELIKKLNPTSSGGPPPPPASNSLSIEMKVQELIFDSRKKVVDLNTNLSYRCNEKNGCRSRKETTQHIHEFYKTGNTKIVDGKLSEEYKVESYHGKTEYFYVIEGLPYIKYPDLKYKFDGFNIKYSKIYAGDTLEITHRITPVQCPNIYLEYFKRFSELSQFNFECK